MQSAVGTSLPVGVPPGRRPRLQGFSLIELLISMAVLLLILVVIFSITNQTGKLWRSTSGKIGAFEQARRGFETMTRNLSQATLNTYYDYDVPTAPTTYVRQSELHFISGPASLLATAGTTWSGDSNPARPTHAVFFQAPIGYDSASANAALNRLLNASGYYLEFNHDRVARPAFLRNRATPAPRYRYRLMEITQPSVNLLVYNSNYLAAKGWPAYNGWFNEAIKAAQVRPVAENIVALVLAPKLSAADAGGLAPEYRYDSRHDAAAAAGLYTGTTAAATRLQHRHQLPPIVQVTMVAIDETSASRLAQRNGTSAPALVDANAFQRETSYSTGNAAAPGDLEKLEASLVQQGLAYRVFSTSVSLRGAKWSRN